jgi:hypothetical protein
MKTAFKILSFALILFLIIPFSIKAQAYAYYSGIVKNTDNQPIENVTVSSMFSQPVTTNSSGEFLVSFDVDFIIPEDSLDAYFTHPEYNTVHKFFAVAEGDTTRDTIIMQILPDLYTVSGKVTYENADPIRIGEVAFFSIDGNPEHSYYTTPDAEGNYQISIPAGSYYVRSRASYRDWPSWAYRYIYYNGADNIDDADIFEVSGNADSLNFIHRLLSVGSISGKVIDAATLQPMEGAEVSVSSMPLLDSMIIGTDADGNYSINVFEGDYSVFAYKPGYKLTFYNQVYNLFEATPVNVSSENLNAAGIDFALSAPDTGTNTISGNVTDEDSGLPLTDAEVFAIPLDEGNWIQSSINPAPISSGKKLRKTDNNGVYTLKNVRNGSYVLLFYKKNYIGVFNDGVSAWESASVITLSGNANINVNSTLKKMNSFGGEISGTVMNSESALSGTLVSAFNAGGNVIASEISSQNGEYIIPCLSEGELTVKASRVGTQTTEYSEKIQINYVSSLTKDGVNLLLTPTDVKDKPVLPKEYKLMQNYSNPFNPSTKIVFELPNTGFVELKVFDVLGNEVTVLVNGEMNAGRHEITFDAKNLSSGMYFYRIKAGNFVKTMKMILMK